RGDRRGRGRGVRALLSRLPVRAVGRQIAGRSHRRGSDRYARRSMTETLKIPAPTWFVGCGNMGGAMLDGWRHGGVDLSPVTVIRPSGKAVDGVRVVTNTAEAGPPPRLVGLAFKHTKLDEMEPALG